MYEYKKNMKLKILNILICLIHSAPLCSMSVESYSLELPETICRQNLTVKIHLRLENGTVLNFNYVPNSVLHVENTIQIYEFCYKIRRLLHELNRHLLGSKPEECEQILYQSAAELITKSNLVTKGFVFLPDSSCGNNNPDGDEILLIPYPTSPYIARLKAELQSYVDLYYGRSPEVPMVSPGMKEDRSSPSSSLNMFCKSMKEAASDVLALNLFRLPTLPTTHFFAPEWSIQNRSRLLCIVYTIDKRHLDAVHSVVHTWGSRCTGFLAFSNLTDPLIPTVSIPHEGDESYDNIWRKIVSIWIHVYRHYITEFDWFYIAGDDAYVIAENMYAYLNSEEILHARERQSGLYIGRQIKVKWEDPSVTYNTGGAGYVLDAKALAILAEALLADQCDKSKESSAEDVYVAECLRKFGILPYDSTDKDHLERFHHFSPRLAWSPEALQSLWWRLHLVSMRPGRECCSPESISFHWLRPEDMIAVHTYIYECMTRYTATLDDVTAIQ